MASYLPGMLLGRPRLGVVIMDFPEYPAEGMLIQLIILCNALTGINVQPSPS